MKSGYHSLPLLVELGSIQKLLGVFTAKKLKCTISKKFPLVVAMAKGAQLNCKVMGEGSTWSLTKEEFIANMFLVALGSRDMVLEM